jgi:excisionase family DNA binding protein
MNPRPITHSELANVLARDLPELTLILSPQQMMALRGLIDAPPARSPARGSAAPPEQADSLLRVPEVAALLSISRAQCYRMAQLGHLQSVRMGKTVRFRRRDVEAFLRQHITGSP